PHRPCGAVAGLAGDAGGPRSRHGRDPLQPRAWNDPPGDRHGCRPARHPHYATDAIPLGADLVTSPASELTNPGQELPDPPSFRRSRLPTRRSRPISAADLRVLPGPVM